MGKYLGFDCSTEGLSAIVIDTAASRTLFQRQLVYEEVLPMYQDTRGVMRSPKEPLKRHSNPQLWAAALEMLFANMIERGIDLSGIDGVCGSAQQHGTVYLNRKFVNDGIVPSRGEDLVSALPSRLAFPTAPLWMDLSTFDECLELMVSGGGAEAWQRRTGSAPCGCYAAAQIRKMWKRHPEEYAATGVVHLVSSFVTSLLTGRSVPVDTADASGMNLMNISGCAWDEQSMDATAPGLVSRLPRLASPGSVAGTISDYLVEKYHFRPGTPVVIGTGGGISRMIGLGVWKPGNAVISLKTCDAYFAAVKRPPAPDSDGYGHCFRHAAEGYIAQSFFQNGGIARRTVRDRYHLEWADFDDRAIQVTPPGNNGNIMLPYFTAESTPLLLNGGPVLAGNDLFTTWQDGVGMVRAVVEAQAMSMFIHTEWIGKRPRTIRLTGSAGRRRGLAQIYADVFNADVERIAVNDAGALGAALRAAHVLEKIDYSEFENTFSATQDSLTLKPNHGSVEVYRTLIERYRQLEKSNG